MAEEKVNEVTPPNPISFDNLVKPSTEAEVPAGTLVPLGAHEVTGDDDDQRTEMSTQYRKWTSQPKFSQKDISYPRLRIGQGTTPEVQQGLAKMGQLVLTGFDAVDSAVVIPLMEAKQRERRDPNDNRKIICQSMDAIVGVGDPGGACVDSRDEDFCPYAKWTGGGTTGTARKKPVCSLLYSYVCYSITHRMLVVFELKNTAIGQAKFINTMIDRRGMGKFAIAISSQKTTNANKQTYSVPVIVPAKVNEEDFKEAVGAIL